MSLIKYSPFCCFDPFLDSRANLSNLFVGFFEHLRYQKYILKLTDLYRVQLMVTMFVFSHMAKPEVGKHLPWRGTKLENMLVLFLAQLRKYFKRLVVSLIRAGSTRWRPAFQVSFKNLFLYIPNNIQIYFLLVRNMYLRNKIL